jgi:type 2 lantibiotic biosynthesis protein LanM
MDELLNDLEMRAATIDELLSDKFWPLPGEKKDSHKAAVRLAAWCRASASGNWQLFARRLARDGLSMESVLSRFATVRRNPITPVPSWLSDAAWLVNALKSGHPRSVFGSLSAGAEPLAFESSLFGVVDAAEAELRSRVRPDELSKFSDEAVGQLNRALLRQLSALCAPAFFDCFLTWRRQNQKGTQEPSTSELNGAVTGGEFEQFVLHMRETGLGHLFVVKPVLLRLMASITRQWIESTCEFIVRLASDVSQVRAVLLGLVDPSPVVSVHDNLSDPHNFGRCVLLVHFEDRCRVLYKPKDLRPDAAWHQVVTWLNANGSPVDLRAARVLVRDGYGWAEFVEHTDCGDQSGVARFYERAGALLALFHVFAAADLHLENLIAAGDQPVPIDLEMILQAGEVESGDRAAERGAMELARKRVGESITAIGLLPAYARSPENDIVGLGGLNGSKTEVNEFYWDNANTDRMCPAHRTKVLETLPNIPTVNDSPVGLCEYAGALRAGFDSYGRFLAENKARIVDQGFFEMLAGVSVRKLVKPTRFYLFLLERLKDHRNMGDGAQWSANLEFIARLTDWDKPEDRLWPLFRAERNALAELNVPYFLAMSDGFEVADRNGIRARDRKECGLDRALNRLHNFDMAEVNWQSRIVSISTAAMPGALKDESKPRAQFMGHEQCAKGSSMRSAILAAAQEAAECIAEVAIRSGPSAAWIGLDWLGDSEVSQLVSLGFDLYNGAPGISLFLAAYANVTGDAVSAELSVEGLAALRSHLSGANAARFARGLGLGGASGLGSIVYALSAIGNLLGKADLLTDALLAAQLFTDELIAADRLFDVIGGSAGGILGLLKVHRLTGDADALARATECGQHLLLNRLRDDRNSAMWSGLGIGCRPLTGISHGAAGFGYALAALHQATGREDFAAAARDCIEFENGFFSPVHVNWPDLRQDVCAQSWPCQWCYGAGGIGLARIATLRCGYHDCITLSADIVHAVKCTERAWPSSVDTLCCGNLGNIEFLDEAGIFLNDRDLRDEAEQRVLRIITEAKRTGDYRWGGGEKQFNLGLFRGLAGVGYTMLRRISPNIPNVLIWE